MLFGADLQIFLNACFISNSVSYLDLSYNHLIGTDGKSVADFLKASKLLTSLRLSWNPLGDEGIEHIANAFYDNNTSNGEDDKNEGCGNTTLTLLDLSHTTFTEKGMQSLAHAFMRNNNISIRSLDISSNAIGPQGISYLLDALDNNVAFKGNLKYLNLKNTIQSIDQIQNLGKKLNPQLHPNKLP